MNGDSLDPRKNDTHQTDAKELYLDQLDHQGREGGTSDRRRHSRQRLRADEGLEVMFDAFDGQPATTRVRPRNLSRGGIAFLHEAYVYPETPCTVVLISQTFQPVEVSGKVVGCRHVSGKLHEIAVAFDREIEPDEYLDIVEEQAGTTPS